MNLIQSCVYFIPGSYEVFRRFIWPFSFFIVRCSASLFAFFALTLCLLLVKILPLLTFFVLPFFFLGVFPFLFSVPDHRSCSIFSVVCSKSSDNEWAAPHDTPAFASLSWSQTSLCDCWRGWQYFERIIRADQPGGLEAKNCASAFCKAAFLLSRFPTDWCIGSIAEIWSCGFVRTDTFSSSSLIFVLCHAPTRAWCFDAHGRMQPYSRGLAQMSRE